MGKKILINTLYNIGIFLCLASAYWGFTNKRYEFLAAGLFVGAIFIVLKIRLLKEVKASMRNGKK